jgi:tetratricopeptide (TPR) repeat protein
VSFILGLVPSKTDQSIYFFFKAQSERDFRMPASFDLIITVDYPSRTAELRLRDPHGVQLAFRQTDFKTFTLSHRHGLFDLEIALDRVNRANALRHLGRFGEAQAEIEACIYIFQHDPTNRAKALCSLANIFSEQGDVAQAITQGRRALALCEELPNPGNRASLHNNIANYLELSGAPSALAESPRHKLAALIYRLVAKLGQDLRQHSLVNYVIDFRRTHTGGAPLIVPRVAELLTDMAFRPLDDWLRQRQVDVRELQANVDQFLEMARQAALKPPTEPSP